MKHFFYLRFLLATVVLFFSFSMQAQVCTGSLGDPVVNITFDSLNGASPYVPTSGYTFQSADCPNDGFYTIINSSYSCYSNTWHNVTKDHSGKGKFMLVNASFEPGDFFVTTVTNLCPNTTYEFSAWILNIMIPSNSIKPDLVFSIEKPDGTFLATYDSGEIPVTSSPEWKKYGLLFTTPADNATIVLRIRNNSPGGYGNDLALDDIGFRPCGGKVTATIQGSSDTVNICEGNTTQYTLSGDASSVYQSPVYQWQTSTDEGSTWQNIPGATTTSYLRLPTMQPGKYWYRFTVIDAAYAGITSCSIASNIVSINVHPLPVVDAGPDRVYIQGYPVTISASASGEDITYYWSPPLYITNDSSLNPVVTPPVDMLYTLHVQSAFNCNSKDEMQVKAVAGLFIPNAFTPYGDGLNDRWNISFLDIGFDADVKIFNRWGNIIYHVSGATVSWDGMVNNIPQPSGTYIFIIKFKDKSLPEIKGTLTLIR